MIAEGCDFEQARSREQHQEIQGAWIVAAASGCIHMIFDAASEHFGMVNQMVNIEPRMGVAGAVVTLSCQRIWRLLSVATKLGPSIGP